MRKKFLFPLLFGIILTAYSTFTLLEAFVIPSEIVYLDEGSFGDESGSNADDDYLTNEVKANAPESPEPPAETGGEPSGGDTMGGDKDDSPETTSPGTSEPETTDETTPEETEPPAPPEPIITENSYICPEFSVTITTVREYDTDIYVADVVLSDISHLKAGLAKNAFGRNLSEKTSKIAKRLAAVLAINGDYYGFRSRGFVMRNGYLYRDSVQKGSGHEDLVVYSDGKFEIIDESGSDANSLAENGAVHIFSFGPGLLRDGEITVDEKSEVELALKSNPRTAIGQIGPLHYVFIVSDGRTDQSAGLTLLQLANFMQSLGCENAYNLDGGGSSTMYFMGKIVNNPTDGWYNGERKVSDIVYIG